MQIKFLIEGKPSRQALEQFTKAIVHQYDRHLEDVRIKQLREVRKGKRAELAAEQRAYNTMKEFIQAIVLVD